MKLALPALRRMAIAAALVCLLLSSAEARTVKQKKQAAAKQLEAADRLRDGLDGTPEADRERSDYQKVIEAYRKVYYTAPSYAKADVAVLAVAELLDDQGRVLDDPKSYHDAIGQLAFLRREYPGSKHRVEALFTIGEIYLDDLNDREQAKSTFQDYLKHYPNSTLAPKARQALAEITGANGGGKKSARAKHTPRKAGPKAAWANARPKPEVASKPERAAKIEAKPEPKSAKRATTRAPNNDAATATDTAAAAAPPTPVQQDASLTKPAPLPGGRMPRLTSIRHWSTPDYVRVAIDLEQEVKYDVGRVPKPDRIFFDLYGLKLAPDLVGKSFDVEAGFLHRIRVAQYKVNMARVVLDVDDVAEYSAFLLPNPYRLIIDIHGKIPASQVAGKQSLKPQEAKSPDVKGDVKGNDARGNDAKGTDSKAADARATDARGTDNTREADAKPAPHDTESDVTVTNLRKPAAPATQPADNTKSAAAKGPAKAAPPKTTEVAKAERPKFVDDNTMESADSSKTTSKPTTAPTYEAVAPKQSSRNRKSKVTGSDANGPAPNTHAAAPAANGERSLTRALGLKIGKIVVDAGHGGHDTGTIGPNGLLEKDLVLDVALKLGKLLEDRLGAEVVYTRDDDTFIPLETRTAVANKEQADLFISIHANSSSDQTARGVETYYLNFTSSRDALEVAARENAVSEKSIHELQDLVKKIALKEKIEESREFASDVQKSLYTGLNAKNPGIRNRGVKKAPFIVLIGANMPSILAEISFVSNPGDAKKLKTGEYRQRIADSLYKGVAKYISGLSGVKVASRNRDGLRSSAAVAAK
jgi:N-acetylmuramoyl-L-alanine amidase